MKSKSLFIIAIAISLAGGWMLKGALSGSQSSTAPAGKSEKKIKYWVAPMNPSFRSDKPGKSPMGMDLVPVYEGEDDDKGGVKVSSRMIQSIGVKTEVIKRTDISRHITTVGVVEADEQKIHKINPKVSGWVKEMFVDTTGAMVKANGMLLSIYSPELVSTEEEYILALGYRGGKGSRKLARSARQRLEYFDVPEHQIKEIERTRKVYKNLHIHSPFPGVVTALNVRPGMHVTPRSVLYEITDLSTVWVNADLYEYEIPWIQIGDEAEILFTALPGKVYRGKVSYIYPYLNPASRTVTVRISVKNDDYILKPQMFASVHFAATPRKNVLAVPTKAILRSGTKEVVVVAEGEGRFHSMKITTGIGSDDYVEVLSGLKEGDRVVTSAQFLIDSESNLNAALEPMEATEEMNMSGMKGMDHSKMNMPGMKGMDHSKMDMPGMKGMDHSKMNMPGMKGMDHSKMNMPAMKGMDHSEMDMPGMKGMDHSNMDMSGMKGMDHSEMDMSGMKGMDHSNMKPRDDSRTDTHGGMQ